MVTGFFSQAGTTYRSDAGRVFAWVTLVVLSLMFVSLVVSLVDGR
jgi:hypothetical protein